MPNKTIVPYENGPYGEIDLTIIDRAPDNPTSKDARLRIRYEVVHGCCNKIETLTHEGITRRLKNHVAMCRYCSRRSNISPRTLSYSYHGVTPPMWPVPPSVRRNT
jgi:hypothetical protein